MKAKTFFKYAGIAAGVTTVLAITDFIQVAALKQLFDENLELEKKRDELIEKNNALVQLIEKEKKYEVCKAPADYDEEKFVVEQSENDISEHDEAES